MSGQMVNFPSNGHTCDGYLATPKSGSGPGLIVIQEYWGLVDHIKTLCDRFAAEGFVALAPDMYHGERTTSPDTAGKLLMALNIDQAGKDMRGAAEYLRAQGAVKPKKVGIMGFCMGGQLALYAAQEHSDVIDAAVDFYGIHPKVTIVPEKLAKVPVQGHFGVRDKSVSMEAVRSLEEGVKKAGGSFEVHAYEAGHAFFNDTRPGIYDAAAAGLAFARTLTFLTRRSDPKHV
jgi:carboxymethylenebutenolidase